MANYPSFTPPRQLSRRSFLALGGATLAQGLSFALPAHAQSVQVKRGTYANIPFYQTTIDLTDPKTFITIGLANNARQANSAQTSYGDEAFESMVARSRAAAVISGTFFSKDDQKRIMGNMVAAGRFLKYSPWENYGTTLGLGSGKNLEMVTARVEGQPKWDSHWFSITAGPRLLNNGKVWLAPKSEGFTDPNVLGRGARAAIGYPRGGKRLVIVTFLKDLTLQQEAHMMRAIGCYEAMNLDGGASLGLSNSSSILLSPKRKLTNVLVVYDAKHPAPTALKDTWARFEKGDRPSIPA